MGDPTSSYATASIAVMVSGALKPHHHDKVATPSVGNYKTYKSIFLPIITEQCDRVLKEYKTVDGLSVFPLTFKYVLIAYCCLILIEIGMGWKILAKYIKFNDISFSGCRVVSCLLTVRSMLIGVPQGCDTRQSCTLLNSLSTMP
jgi:hypothetical protein